MKISFVTVILGIIVSINPVYSKTSDNLNHKIEEKKLPEKESDSDRVSNNKVYKMIKTILNARDVYACDATDIIKKIPAPENDRKKFENIIKTLCGWKKRAR